MNLDVRRLRAPKKAEYVMADTTPPEQARSLDSLLWPDDDQATMHDAFLLNLMIDYVGATAELALDVWVGDLDSPDPVKRDARRAGTLLLERVCEFSIEPPTEYRGPANGDGLWIDAELGDPGSNSGTVDTSGGQQDGQARVRFWIYVSNWNSFMRIECERLQFVWSDVETSPPN